MVTTPPSPSAAAVAAVDGLRRWIFRRCSMSSWSLQKVSRRRRGVPVFLPLQYTPLHTPQCLHPGTEVFRWSVASDVADGSRSVDVGLARDVAAAATVVVVVVVVRRRLCIETCTSPHHHHVTRNTQTVAVNSTTQLHFGYFF